MSQTVIRISGDSDKDRTVVCKAIQTLFQTGGKIVRHYAAQYVPEELPQDAGIIIIEEKASDQPS